jgi:hypothetical protein
LLVSNKQQTCGWLAKQRSTKPLLLLENKQPAATWPVYGKNIFLKIYLNNIKYIQ